MDIRSRVEGNPAIAAQSTLTYDLESNPLTITDGEGGVTAKV